MKINEMIYQTDRKVELLYYGTYKKYNYFIFNLGTHPTAYIEIPQGNKLYGKDYSQIDLDVHGGLTYSSDTLMLIKSNSWFIGWDYAHAEDYMGYYEEFKEYNIHTLNSDYDNKKWTTKEIIAECKRAINEIVRMEKK